MSNIFAKEEVLEMQAADGPVDFREELRRLRQDMLREYRDIIKPLDKLKGEGDDISD